MKLDDTDTRAEIDLLDDQVARFKAQFREFGNRFADS